MAEKSISIRNVHGLHDGSSLNCSTTSPMPAGMLWMELCTNELNFEMLETLGHVIKKPIQAHLMVVRPQDYVERLIDNGVSEISFHIDTVNRQIFRLMNILEKAKVGVGMVINPMETVDQLQYVLERLDSVCVMTVDACFAGQHFIPEMLKKITLLKDLKIKHGYKYEIEVDGGVNMRTFDQLMEAGAERFILGSSGLFNLADTLEDAIGKARSYIPFK